jgi:hypothetical protein
MRSLSGDRLFCRERRNGGVPAGCSSSASTLDARTLPDLATLDAVGTLLDRLPQSSASAIHPAIAHERPPRIETRLSAKSGGYQSRSAGSTAQARSPRTRPRRSRCLATHR